MILVECPECNYKQPQSEATRQDIFTRCDVCSALIQDGETHLLVEEIVENQEIQSSCDLDDIPF